jgi:LacI family transcriptional regulator, gluconate utilization system Gnt-I transcriptional repressor
MASAPRTRKRAGRATMADVAKLAGVSAITVSRLLRDPATVSADLAARIRQSIDRLGYVPNLMAGGLAAATSRIVGVIVPSIRNAFFAASVDALARALEPRGLSVFDASTEYDLAREDSLVETMLAWNPAALVLTGFAHGPRLPALLARAKLPVVEIWDTAGRPIDMAVGFDHRAVGRKVVRHLLAQGRKRIAFVGAMLEADTRAGARCEGMRQELEAVGLTPIETIDLPRSSNVGDGAMAFAKLLDAPIRMEAAFFSNDILALGALFECQRRGIAVPEEIALVGFGDQDFAAHSVPRLTTVRPPREAIGREAARLILARLDGEEPAAKTFDVGFELVVRESG